MPALTPVDRAFDDLAHGFRILLEAHVNAGRGLLVVDRAEAVGNIETALTAVLHGFHSLYDALDKAPRGAALDWYAEGALATILAIRNARHHNKANKIRTLYTYHAEEADRPTRMEMYVHVGFPSPDPDATTFDLYLSWADLKLLLDMPSKESRIPDKTRAVIETYLGSVKFAAYAEFYKQSESRVFFNVVPLLVNAGLKIVPTISPPLRTVSDEGGAFASLFTTEGLAMTDTPTVDCGPFLLPD